MFLSGFLIYHNKICGYLTSVTSLHHQVNFGAVQCQLFSYIIYNSPSDLVIFRDNCWERVCFLYLIIQAHFSLEAYTEQTWRLVSARWIQLDTTQFTDLHPAVFPGAHLRTQPPGSTQLVWSKPSPTCIPKESSIETSSQKTLYWTTGAMPNW